MTDQPANSSTARRPWRWWQFGLRALLLLVVLVALCLLGCREYLRPYWRQQQTAALIEQLGGSCQTAEASPWLRLLGSMQNITRVKLADCNDPDAYLAQIAELPAIELLIVGGLAFTDEHATRLHRMRSLRGLILDSTSVSDEGMAALREALRGVEVYASQRRAIGNFGLVGLFDFEPHPLQDMADDDELFDEAKWVLVDKEFSELDAAYLRVLRRLETVRLARVTDEALKQLPISLRRVILQDTDVTDAGLEHLTEMPQLRELYLGGTRVTAAGVANLRRSLPRCQIHGPEQLNDEQCFTKP